MQRRDGCVRRDDLHCVQITALFLVSFLFIYFSNKKIRILFLTARETPWLKK